METQKNSENIILNLKRQIGKMMVQVDFLHRNGREMSQFDYDILMDRTRELYEYLIDCQTGNLKDDYDIDNDNDTNNENEDIINNDVEFEIETPSAHDEIVEEQEEKIDEDDVDDEDWEDEEDVTFTVEPLKINKQEEEKEEEKHVEAREEQIHVNFLNPVENKSNPVDDSLAARLQRQPVSDIKSGIMLNDRIMMINDLFKGSPDRYSKAINELNEFPTLGGALVYMSELRVELQWDIESEAYLKLKELVERRFL